MTRKVIPDIKFNEKEVILRWPAGEEVRVSNRDLRLSCRCALCSDELTGRKLIREEDIKSNIAPKEVFPLGNYAIGISWNDGHSSGIYPYKNIQAIAKKS